MAYFPFFQDISGMPGLIVGGGTVALRKIEKLLPFGPKLTVIAPEILPEIQALSQVMLEFRKVQEKDLSRGAFVLAATDDRAVNTRVAHRCRELHIPVNVADSRAESTFLFPALVQRGPLTVGISTGGGSPSAAIYLKEQISRLIPENFEDILEFLHTQRSSLQKEHPECAQDLMRTLFYSCLKQKRVLTDGEVSEIIRRETETWEK